MPARGGKLAALTERRVTLRIICQTCGVERSNFYFDLLNPTNPLDYRRGGPCALCKKQAVESRLAAFRAKIASPDYPLFVKARRVAITNKYRASKLRAMPSWADQQKILDVYARCKKLTQETGIEHQVDHVIPLQVREVCGLHIHQNLQIIYAAANAAKHNRFNPDDFEDTTCN